MAWKPSGAKRGSNRRSRACANDFCLSSSLPSPVPMVSKLQSENMISYISRSWNIRRQRRPWPGGTREVKSMPFILVLIDLRSQSTSSKLPNACVAFSPTSTCGVLSHVRKNPSTTPFIIESIAVSLGFREAFSITVIARMFAEGAGERRAWMRDSSEASVNIWVKGIGLRSLMARLVRMAGSFWKEVRI